MPLPIHLGYLVYGLNGNGQRTVYIFELRLIHLQIYKVKCILVMRLEMLPDLQIFVYLRACFRFSPPNKIVPNFTKVDGNQNFFKNKAVSFSCFHEFEKNRSGTISFTIKILKRHLFLNVAIPIKTHISVH